MKKILLITLITTLAMANNQIVKLSEKQISHTKFSNVKAIVVCVGSSKMLITHSYSPNDYANSSSSTLIELNAKECSK